MKRSIVDLESPESSSPIVTRSVAAGLSGEYLINYQFPMWQKIGLRALGYFPQTVGRKVVKWAQSGMGLNPGELYRLKIDTLVQARLADYQGWKGKSRAVIVGVAQGGATAHLAMALRAPFLPEAFVLTLKGGSPDGDILNYYQRSATLALHIAANNPQVITIQHFDPIHDGWLTKRVNHLRLKLLDLPEGYKQYIKETIEPGGSVIYLNGGASWLRFRVGERSVFQVGGWGDISTDEFVEGSERIERIGRKEGLTEFNWQLPGFPLERGAESEWGSEPGLCEALERFCTQEGYNFINICFPSPNDFSRLAFLATQRLFENAGKKPSGTIVEMFTQFDGLAPLKCGLLPLWLVYNTRDSLNFLKEMSPSFPADQPVFFSPLSTFSITPDLTPWNQWEFALKSFTWQNIGTRASHYPSDTGAVAGWQEKFQKWCKKHEIPDPGTLGAEELADLARQVIEKHITGMESGDPER